MTPTFLRNVKLSFFCLIACVTVGGIPGRGQVSTAGEVLVELDAGSHDREHLSVSVPLPEALRDADNLALKRLSDGRLIPIQRTAGDDPRAVWIVRDKLSAGETRRYALSAGGTSSAAGDGVTVTDDGKALRVAVGKKPVLVYNQAIVRSPDPKTPCYDRSGYIHPVYTPSGKIITDDFNPDHAHQHGIMFAWRNCTFEGRKSNAWDQLGGTGRIEHVATEAFGGGPVFGQFTVKLRQLDLTAPDGPKPVLDETWRVRVDRFDEFFVFDLEVTQQCAGKTPVHVEKYLYGGLAVRGANEWSKDKPGNCNFRTDLGKTRENGNHTPAKWVDFHGPLGKGHSGIDVMCHPANFRFPQLVRLHPEMPYFSYTPEASGKFTIKPGEPFVSRYRFCVYDGKLTPKAAETLWNNYADPPVVRLVR